MAKSNQKEYRMTTCLQCHKQINRVCAKFCHRCGHSLIGLVSTFDPARRRASRLGIASGVIIAGAIVGLFHHAGIRVGIVPFVTFGGQTAIAFFQPTSAHAWLFEIAATVLMVASFGIPWLRIGTHHLADYIHALIQMLAYDLLHQSLQEDAEQFGFSAAMTVIALIPYVAGTLCVGIGQ
jgi:hypothetical protein